MRRLDEFIGEPHGRHKSRCPDLGHLLTLLALSSSPRHAWPRVAPAVLQEALARNVRWVFQAHPECEELQALLSSSPDAVSNAMTDLLLERTRDGSATSQRVLMFNAAFARLVARREGAAPGAVLAWCVFTLLLLGDPIGVRHPNRSSFNVIISERIPSQGERPLQEEDSRVCFPLALHRLAGTTVTLGGRAPKWPRTLVPPPGPSCPYPRGPHSTKCWAWRARPRRLWWGR